MASMVGKVPQCLPPGEQERTWKYQINEIHITNVLDIGESISTLLIT